MGGAPVQRSPAHDTDIKVWFDLQPIVLNLFCSGSGIYRKEKPEGAYILRPYSRVFLLMHMSIPSWRSSYPRSAKGR